MYRSKLVEIVLLFSENNDVFWGLSITRSWYKTNRSWFFALEKWFDAGVGAAKNTDWFMCSAFVRFSIDSSVNSLVSWANCRLLWRNFERRLELVSTCGRKDEGFGEHWWGDIDGKVSYCLVVFHWILGNPCRSLRLELSPWWLCVALDVIAYSSWWFAQLSRLLTFSSKFSRQEIKFEWRIMTDFMLLELFFSTMMLSRFVDKKRECASFFSAQRMSARDQAERSHGELSHFELVQRVL